MRHTAPHTNGHSFLSTKHRILPLLATAFAFHFTGQSMQELIVGGDTAAIHMASSGLKSLCSRVTADGIEACRKACGGHGYLSSSGLPDLLGTYLQNCTVEGENYMIAQQTAKQLVKKIRDGSSGSSGSRYYSLTLFSVHVSQYQFVITRVQDST